MFDGDMHQKVAPLLKISPREKLILFFVDFSAWPLLQ
jgi:hypothetical protein